MSTETSDPHSYRERLRAPLSWWLGALAFGIISAWVLLVASTWYIAGVVGGIATALAAGLVWAYGRVTIEFDAESLTVGRAHIDRKFLGEAEALTGKAWDFQMGPGADHRALFVSRPWLRGGVKFTLTDPDDPAPYWLVGSRQPATLAAAVGHTGTAHPKDEGASSGQAQAD